MAFIELPPDGVGKKVATDTNAGGEHLQVVAIGSAAGGKAPVDTTKGMAVDLTATGQNATPLRVIVTDDQSVTGAATASIAAGTVGNTVVKATPGRLVSVLVITVGTHQLNIFDNAAIPAGAQIGLIPANTDVGTFIEFSMPAAHGIVVQGDGNNPGVTIAYS